MAAGLIWGTYNPTNQKTQLYSHRYTPPGVSYILVLFNLAIRFPSALYVLEAFRIHIRYMCIGCMQSTLWPISMTMLIWNDLMTSQHDNLSRGSPRLMTSDRQILYPHIPLAVTPLVALRLRRSRSSSSSPSRRRRRLPLVGVDVGEFCLTLIAF